MVNQRNLKSRSNSYIWRSHKKIYKVQFGTIKRELLTYDAKKLRDIFDKSYFYDNYMHFYKETGTMFVTLNDNNIAKEILSGIEFKCFFGRIERPSTMIIFLIL